MTQWQIRGAILVLFFLITSFIFRSIKTNIYELGFNNITLSENSLLLAGSISSSAIAYRRYNYNINDDTLIITIYSGLVLPSRREGSFNIRIKNAKISDVKYIFIKDKAKLTQIYP